MRHVRSRLDHVHDQLVVAVVDALRLELREALALGRGGLRALLRRGLLRGARVGLAQLWRGCGRATRRRGLVVVIIFVIIVLVFVSEHALVFALVLRVAAPLLVVARRRAARDEPELEPDLTCGDERTGYRELANLAQEAEDT